MSAITIYPYSLGNCWVFDDARTGLKEEALVLGSSEMMTRLVEAKGIRQAEKGKAVRLTRRGLCVADGVIEELMKGNTGDSGCEL